MPGGTRRTCQGLLTAAALLVAADVASRLAYSEAAVAAQVDLAVRRTAEIQAGVAVPEAGRRPLRLRVSVLP